MSRSPRDEKNPDQIFQYRKGWAAINTMLEQGRSLSGRERHCAFLNTKGKRFADISAASGLDLLDDGRGVALVDWDFDGRIDLWTTNRTGPWVRLLYNKSGQNIGERNFVSIALQGIDCNRDAIGARLELYVGGDSPRVLTRSLRAGEGFVSQSSKRILFALGDDTAIEKLVVRWPGGKPQTVTGLRPGKHYRILQGISEARVFNPPEQFDLPEPPEAERPEAGARIVLAGRIPLPELKYLNFQGREVSLQSSSNRPVLINLWASWCLPCVTEMGQWQENWEDLKGEVSILALNVEHLDADGDIALADTEQFVAQRKYPFTCGAATQELLELLQISVNALVDKPQTLVVPTSILLDPEGRAAVIYRGPVTHEQLKSDLAAINENAEARRKSAAKFAGRWFDQVPPGDPAVLLRNFAAAGRVDYANAYLQQWLADTNAEASPPVESFYVVADAYRGEGNLQQAAKLYRQALDGNPDQPRVNLDLGICYIKLGQFEDAASHLKKSLTGDPGNADTRKRLVLVLSRLGRFAEMQKHAEKLVDLDIHDSIARLHLAHALKKQKQYAPALRHYRQVVEQQPENLIALNDIAWLLATCPDENIRDGKAAVAYAARASGAANHSHPALLDTLAAAQAEAGQFEEAVETVQSALKRTGGDARLAEILQEHLGLYQNRKPLREE